MILSLSTKVKKKKTRKNGKFLNSVIRSQRYSCLVFQISSLAKIENQPSKPMQLFEEYLKEGTENGLQGIPPTFNLATSNK